MDKYFNAFNLIKSLTYKTFQKLYNAFPNLKFVWEHKKPDILINIGVKPEIAFLILDEKSKINPEIEYEKLISKDIKTVILSDPDYPKLLKNIYDPPLMLYYKGDIKILNSAINIGIVGTRRFSLYGEYATKKIVKDLALNNFCIVSGLAKGVDTIAHKEALENNGKTAAVLGSSLDIIYPLANRKLASEIVKTGVLISEFPLGTPPNHYNFPRRNRIISGLSKGVIVTEAPEKSGALITAGFALSQDRDIFAVPGDINRDNSRGTNLLIQRCEAKLIFDAVQVFESFELNINPSSRNINLSHEENQIVNILKTGANDINYLLIESPFDITRTLKVLSILEIKGIIKQQNGTLLLLI